MDDSPQTTRGKEIPVAPGEGGGGTVYGLGLGAACELLGRNRVEHLALRAAKRGGGGDFSAPCRREQRTRPLVGRATEEKKGVSWRSKEQKDQAKS